MAIETTPFQEEIQEIFLKGPNPVHSHWKCLIETPEVSFEPLKVFSIDIQRLYDEHFADHVLLDVTVPLGTFTSMIMPNKEELTVSITRIPLGEVQLSDDIDDEVVVKRYRAIITNETLHTVTSDSGVLENPENANLSDIVRFEIQLLDIGLEEIRLREVGGIYRDEIPGNVIKYILTDLSNDLNLAEEDAILGVDMVEPDNRLVSKHVIIPHGTKPQDIPALIQDECGGVYNTGIGCYLQNGIWYVWPEFNVKRFDSGTKTLTIINLPPNRYPGVERTYRTTDNQVIILSTGEVTQKDFSHHGQLNKGSGTRFAHGDRIMDGYGVVKDNKFFLDRSKNLTEVNLINRPNYSVAPTSYKRITNNLFSETSRIAKRQGSFVNLVWENSQPELLYPGMPVKLLFLDKDEIVEVEGVLMRCHHFIYDNREGLIRGRHICNTSMVLFMDKLN